MISWPGAPRPCVDTQTNPNTLTGSRRSRKHGTKGEFGDPLTRKGKDVIRILLWNTNGIGFTSSDRTLESLKMEKFKKLVQLHAFDFTALTELNKNWSKVDTANSIWAATSSWRQSRRLQVSYNKNYNTETPRQIGGTASMALDEISYRICSQKNDPRDLGRWSQITVRGKHNLQTTFITCYCPVRSTSSPGSAYSQHLVYMSQNKELIPADCKCPRQLFGHDLFALIESLQQQNHQIILMGDFNSDYTKLADWMHSNGLVDVIRTKHGSCPRTCKRSQNAPIDCVFASPNIKCQKGGFLSFSKLVSDHRGVWCDIPANLIFGYNPPQVTHPNARRLLLSDPRVKSKYIQYVQDHLSLADIRAMNMIHSHASYPLSPLFAEEYERLDTLSSKIMDKAEKNCRRFKMGNTPWSPTYKTTMLTFEYWCQREDYTLGLHRNVRDLIVLQRKLHISYDPSMPIQEIRDKKYECYLKRRKCKNIAEQLSLEYRYKLAQAREEAGLGTAASYIRSRNSIETQRRTFRNIRHIEKRMKGASTTHVDVTQPDGSIQEITQQAQMERAMLQENPRKYHQCETGDSSAFLTQTFIDLFGYHGEGPATLEVLQGTFIPPEDTDEDTKAFLEACKQVNQPPTQQSVAARYINMRKSWASRKEKTASNNQHMAHYKCLMEDDTLSWFFYQRAEIPMITGYSPRRHRTCVDLMILKKAGCYELSKLRTLGLLDTEFNNNNRILSKEATALALENKGLATEQFSRPGRSAIDQSILKRCTFDHHRSRRLCYSLCSSDLAGCYDRIVHTAAALALLRLGVSHTKIHAMFSSIQRMIHKVRTAYGDSDNTYGGDDIGDWTTYPQGVLQGNASGPGIWSILSSVIFEILRQRGFSNQFCSVISGQLFLLVGFSYVDDCDLFQSGTDRHEVLESMQDLITNWGGLMKVTGGALRVDKSWWYLVEFVWIRGSWVPTDAGNNLHLHATDASGAQVELTYLPCHLASKMLGIWMAPNGNNEKLVSHLKDHALDWASKFQTSTASQLESWTALQSTISPQLKYPLPTSSLSEKDCISIMNPVISTALRKSGIVSTVATDARHGPLLSGGYGVLSLFHFQGTARTAALVEHCCRQTPTGMQIHLCIEDLILEAGYFGLLWQMPFQIFANWVSTHSWVFSVCEYNFANEITLNTDHAKLLPKRTNDKPIMALVANHFDSSSALSAINRVRMFHGVVSLADITTADGRFLNDEFLCPSEFDGRRNDFLWPIDHHVSGADFTWWRKAMEFLFPAHNLSLIQPLGTCIIDKEEDWLSHWDWFVPADRSFLYRQVGENFWHRHLRKEGTNRSYHLQYLLMDERPDFHLHRASVTSTNRSWILFNTDTSCPNLRPTNNPEYIGAIPFLRPTEDWFLHNLQHSHDTDILWANILQGTALAISDGSFYPDESVGACAWKIATPCLTQWIKAGGLVPGPYPLQSAYRSEVAGQTGIALFLSSLLLPDNVSPIITSACDGKSALSQSKDDTEFIRSSTQHVDLLSITADAWSKSPFQLRKVHVRGHQENLGRPLTTMEIVNCEMDEDAKELATSHISQGYPPLQTRSSTKGIGTIYIRNKMVVSRIQNTLYTSILHHNFVDRVAKKFGTDPIIFDELVNWKSFGLARKSAPFSLQKFISKWINGDIPTGKKLKERKHRTDAACPLCNKPNEDLLHILTCRNLDSEAYRLSQLTALEEWLIALDTHQDIVQFLISGLKSWFSDPTGYEPFHHASTHALHDAFTDQLQFSWFAILCGFLTSSLTHQQHLHYKAIGSRRSGNRWTINLISKLWSILHNIWKMRNDSLHSNQRLSQLSGLETLKIAIQMEHEQGVATLPTLYTSYFSTPLPTLLKKSNTHLKQWFLVIRSAREGFSGAPILDEFYTNPVLRTWVGLNTIDTG